MMKFFAKPVALFLPLLLVVVACGGDEEEKKSGTGTEEQQTSGGETGGGSAIGVGEDGSDTGWDGDPEGNAGLAQGASEDSPWGTPESNAGKPLPDRKPMNSSAQDAYEDAVESATAGNMEGARVAFEQALASDPGAYKAAYNLGVIADRSGNEARALEYYRRSLKIQPDYERAAAGIVAIYVRRGDASGAVAFAAPLARDWERNLYLQAVHGEALVHANQYDAAVDAARKALRRDEKFVPAMVVIVKASLGQGRKELAANVLDQAMAIQGGNAELQYLKGMMLLEEDGRLREAIDRLKDAVRLRPDYAEARTALGIQLMQGGNYQEALTHLLAASKLTPSRWEVHLNLADAFRANKMWKEAKDAFQKALDRKSPLPEAHFNMGLMYMTALGEYPGMDTLQALDAAIAEFKQYRSEMGPRLPKDDLSAGYLEDLQRQRDREQKRIEREKKRAEREAARSAREAAGGGDAAGGGEGGE